MAGSRVASNTNLSEIVPSGEKCTICLEQVVFNNSNKAIAQLTCGHVFHLSCIGCEFNAKGVMQCPNCRTIENSNWLFTASDNGDQYIIVDAATDMCPPNCPCLCHGGHNPHATPNCLCPCHGAHNPPHATARETRGRETRGRNANAQGNVHIQHRHDQHNYVNVGAIPSFGTNNISYGISTAAYQMYPPTNIFDWYVDRHQILANRRRAINYTTYQDRRRVRPRLTTANYDNQQPVNPNTHGSTEPTTSNIANADTVSDVSLQLTLAPPGPGDPILELRL